MRQITEQIATSFRNGESKSVGNSRTDGQSVWLHGNKIAEKTDGILHLTLSNWNTPTTRERLNGILQTFGLNNRYHQKNFEAMLDDEPVDESAWTGFNY